MRPGDLSAQHVHVQPANSFRVAVLGGGISGLAAAHFLRKLYAPARLDITVVEADPRLGGKVRTDPLASRPVEGGPDGFLARVPEALELCCDLGLAESLVSPGGGPAYLWMRGRLRAIPGGMGLGVPTGLSGIAFTGLLSPFGVARAALDLALPRTRLAKDESVSRLVAARFGSEVAERLVDPLLSGIFAGDAGQLSARAVTPELYEVAQQSRSLLLGLRRLPKTPQGPGFCTVRDGLETLVARIRAGLPDVRWELGCRAMSIDNEASGRYSVALEGGRQLEAEAVVVALPAFAAATVLRQLSPAAASALSSIGYSSVATVAMAYPIGAMPPLRGTGFLVPRREGRLVVGCTWLSSKWPHLSGGPVLVRCAVGRVGDERWRQLDDRELTRRVHAELEAALDSNLPTPEAWRVTRWERAIPQYTVGHLERVESAERELAGWPGLVLTGAAYRGVGVASCIAQAKTAAARVVGLARMEKGAAD